MLHFCALLSVFGGFQFFCYRHFAVVDRRSKQRKYHTAAVKKCCEVSRNSYGWKVLRILKAAGPLLNLNGLSYK